MRARPGKGNPIPSRTRQALAVRDGGACMRCGLAATDIHHRRSRRVRDEHCHCTCNTVSLCRNCHAYVHANPDYARALGWIVSREEVQPGAARLKMYSGWLRLGCEGDMTHLDTTVTS